MPLVPTLFRKVRPRRLIPALFGILQTVMLARAIDLKPDGYHVSPGENIQDAIDLAARNPTNKTVRVLAGEYRPKAKRQALIYFNRAHSGVKVEAVGAVTLSAANPEVATASSRSFPAVVNHVVYFGDGVGSNTLLKGFRISGANAYVTDKFLRQMEPDETVPKNSFFLTDGGAIKIFGRSYPVLEDLEVVDNYTTPCGGGVSVQHQGFNTNHVVMRNCVFRNNRAQVTGAAVDLLEGSAARLINCLFVENASNLGVDLVAKRSGEAPFTNSGVLTIFQNSRALVENCTFTGNRNGVDDMGGQSMYLNSIFSGNTVAKGLPGERYELDLARGGVVKSCFFKGRLVDPLMVVSESENVLDADSPMFDEEYTPRGPGYESAGYRATRRAR
jgi:hypothetical protein